MKEERNNSTEKLITFCKIDFKQMRLHRWHLGALAGQALLVVANVAIILWVNNSGLAEAENYKLVWEAILICVIGPTAAAAAVVCNKLGVTWQR